MDDAKRRVKQRNIILGAAVCAGAALLYAARGIFFPLILSLTLAYILYPFVRALESGHAVTFHKKVPRVFSILISYACLLLFFSLIIAFTAQPLTEQTKKLSSNFDDYVQKIKVLLREGQRYYLSYEIPDAWTDVAVKESKELVVSLFEGLRKAAVSYPKMFFSYLVELILVPILTFYLLLDREKLRDGMLFYFPMRNKERMKNMIGQVNATLDGYVRGQVLLCGMMTLVSTVFFYILGIDFALLCGLFAGVTKAVPIVGSIFGAVLPCVLALLEPHSSRKILYIVVFFVIVYLVENKILLPKIMEYYVHLHPVSIIMSLLIGGKIAGILGMFVAVPAAAMVKILWVNFLESYFNEGGEAVV